MPDRGDPTTGVTAVIPKVAEAKCLDDYKIWIRFADGKAGVIDLSEELWGPAFEPLRDLATFRTIRVHPELETLNWPNGADFAPEFLYEQISASRPPNRQ